MSSQDMPGVMLAPGWMESARFRLLDCDAALVEVLKGAPADVPADAADAGAEPPRSRHCSELLLKGDGVAAYLTTPTVTHAIRRVEFSNSLLILRNNYVVEKCKYVFECNPSRPRTEHAEALLRPNYVTQEELEGLAGPPAPAKLVTLAGLRAQVPASNAALDEWLESQGALLQGPFVRLVHPALLSSVLDAAVRVLEARGVATLGDGIALAALQDGLVGAFGEVLLKAGLEAHGTIGLRPERKVEAEAPAEEEAAKKNDDETRAPTAAADASEGGLWWLPDQRRVVARLGDILLKEQDQDWRADAYFAALGQRYSLLAGLGPLDVAGIAAVIDGKNLRRLPQSELPYDPLERYKRMSETKPRWSAAELEGYLGPLEVSGKELANFIGKHCREHKDHAGKGVPTTYSLV